MPYYAILNGNIAQLVEQYTFNVSAKGSSPFVLKFSTEFLI